MNNSTHTTQAFKLRPLIAALALTSTMLNAAPGTLADSPLYLTNSVQPNILFIIDDSGSMDWEVQMSKGAITAYGDDNNSGNLDFTPDDTTEQLELCIGYNVLAFNPNVTYTAWAGKDDAGNTYPASMSFTAARQDPYSASGSTTNLTGHVYYAWTDSDSDGAYDAGECATTSTSIAAAQQTNYANWYSYYRKREFVAKRAVSELIKNSTTRMGLSTLHNNNTVRTLVTDVDDLTTPVDSTAQTNKQTLLNNLFRINSSGGTPLRSALRDAGEYFKGNSSWGSTPILSAGQGGACQQNFTVLMSDGYWNGDSGFDIGDQDSSPTPWAGGTYADGATTWSNTLADVAMKYYKEDLSSLTDSVPVTSVDPQNLGTSKMHQHMVTFTAAFGVDGTLSAGPTSSTGTFNWPQPVADTQTAIDDMRHAAWNGRGDFLSAQDPQSLINGLGAAFAAISGRTSSAASVAFNTTSLSAESEVYLALFNSDKWSGDLYSYALDPETGEIADDTTWKASVPLNQRNLASDPRTIYTWNGSDGAAFQWANLTTAQKNDFRTNSSGGTDNEAAGLARFHYMRGDRVCEQSYTGTSASIGASSVATCSYAVGSDTFTTKNLRNRDGRLGDIVDSSPVYVGKPAYGWPDTLSGTTPYKNFKLAHANRAGMIYIGANDGMLHGFSASTGSEVMSYVPGSVYSTVSGYGLHTLSESAYSHKFYVDLTPSVVDAYVKTTAAGTAGWNTILIGGLRAGGRGLFALDVTSPSFNESGTTPADKVMWEFTSANDADLGYTFSQVSIVPMNNGKWAAIFGNGYNDTGTGQASLFILFIEEGLDGTWSATDYKKLSTGVGSTTDRNGLASPSVIDTNGDYKADRIYAGDLLGNMWVFDVSGSNTDGWGLRPTSRVQPRARCLLRSPINPSPPVRSSCAIRPYRPRTPIHRTFWSCSAPGSISSPMTTIRRINSPSMASGTPALAS